MSHIQKKISNSRNYMNGPNSKEKYWGTMSVKQGYSEVQSPGHQCYKRKYPGCSKEAIMSLGIVILLNIKNHCANKSMIFAESSSMFVSNKVRT